MCLHALIMMEHRYEQPDSPFAMLVDEFIPEHGSYELRNMFETIGDVIGKVYDATHDWSVDNCRTDLGDSLMTATGCWDFDVLPKVLDYLAAQDPQLLEHGVSPMDAARAILRMAEPDVALDIACNLQEILRW